MGWPRSFILVMAALGGCWFPVQMMSLPFAFGNCIQMHADPIGRWRLSGHVMEWFEFLG